MIEHAREAGYLLQVSYIRYDGCESHSHSQSKDLDVEFTLRCSQQANLFANKGCYAMCKLRIWLNSSALALFGICFASAAANAQEPAKGLMTTKPATAGSTDVTTEGFDKIDVKKDAKANDATELQLSAGALTSSGNARLLAFTGTSRFRARREDN